MGFYSNPFSPWHLIQTALEHSCQHLEKEIIVFPVMKRDLIHTHPPPQDSRMKISISEASSCSPASRNTNLTFRQGEDGSFCIYNDHNKQTLFPISTAEFRDNFPLTTHTAMVTVSFHFSPQVVYAVSPSSLSSFKCKKSATMNREK